MEQSNGLLIPATKKHDVQGNVEIRVKSRYYVLRLYHRNSASLRKKLKRHRDSAQSELFNGAIFMIIR
jgi:hypothetical protein